MGSYDEPESDSDDDSIAGRLRHTPEPDYYALLNVSHTATREQVKAAYASLARALHPDKNPQAVDDTSSTSQYNEAFEQVHKAYLVLSSPTYRPIYDEFGLHGVHELQRLTASDENASSEPSRKEEEIRRRRMGAEAPLDRWYEMQVSQYDEFGFNLRDRVLDKLRRRRELLDMRNTGLSSTTNAQIDARKCFGSLLTGDVRGMFHNRPSLRLMRLEQWSAMVLSESTQVNAATTVRLDGQGQGVGEITMSAEHTFNDVDTGTVAVGVRTTDPDDDEPHNLDYVMVNARRQLSHDLACTVALMWRDGNVLGLSLNNEIHLDARNKGSFQFGFGCLNFAYLSLNRSSMYRTHRRNHPSRMSLSMWPGAAAAEKEQTGTEKQKQQVGDVDWDNLTAQHQEDQRWGPRRDGESGPEETTSSSRVDGGSDEQVMDDAKNLTLQAGPGSIGSELTWMRSLTKNSGAGMKLIVAVSGLRIAVFTKRRWSSARVGEMALSVGTTGLNLDFGFGNGLHKLKIPIVLATQVTAPAVMVASLIPLLLNYSVLRLLAPMHKRRKQKEILYLKKDLTKERVRSRVQLRMMVRAADQRGQLEEKRGGLVILLARYGARLGTSCSWDDSNNSGFIRTNKQQNDSSTTPVAVARDGTSNAVQHVPLTRSVRRSVMGWVRSAGAWVGSLGGWMKSRSRAPSDWEEELTARGGDSPSGLQDGGEGRSREAAGAGGNDTWLPPNIDVTSQLQFFVRDGFLKLPASSKAYMLGLYNPCHGLDNVMPELLVRYSFAGQVFEIVAQDVDPLQLPSPRAVHVGGVRGSPVEWRT